MLGDYGDFVQAARLARYGSTCYAVRMTVRMSGPARLRAWMKKAGLNQREFADLVRVHQTTVSGWLLGHAVPPLPIALRLRAVTKIPIEAWAGQIESSRRAS